MCLGAGIWEEVLFRFILITILINIFKLIIRDTNMHIYISIVISGIIFSLFHYIGSNPDLFTLRRFS